MKPVFQSGLRSLRAYFTLAILLMGGGSVYSLPYLSSFFYIPMKEAMHLNNVQIGLMGSAFGFTSMIFYWPGGWVADRVSPRKLIAFSLIADGFLGFWLATFPSFKMLLTIQLLMGIFLSLTYWSAAIKMVRQLASTDQQGRYFGIFEGGRNVTTVAIFAVAIYLFDSLGSNSNGLRWSIILCSVILLALAALSWIYLPETTAGGATFADAKREMSLLAAVVRVVRIPAVWLTMFIILGAYANSIGSNYFTPYATDVYKQSVVFGGVLSLIGQATGIFAPVLAGFVADRWTASRTILWLLVTLASGLLLFVIIPGGPHLFPLLLINSIVISCVVFALRGIYFALLEEGEIPVALTGTATGLISLVAYTPDVFVPAIAGHLLDTYAARGLGYRCFFMILSLFAAAGAGFTLLFRYCFKAKPVFRGATIFASPYLTER